MTPQQIRRNFLSPGNVDIESAVANGMLRKADLKDGWMYEGSCRNSSVASWNAERQRFYYIRTKFGQRFSEEINHPEDDNGFDLFIPIREIGKGDLRQPGPVVRKQ